MSASRAGSRRSTTAVLRYAHPYYAAAPAAGRAAGTRPASGLLSHIQGTLNPIPALKRNQGRWSLDEVIGAAGAAEIQASGRLTMHLAGDTGVPETDHETRQVMVADAMAKDYHPSDAARNPAFLLHLGDVIYGASATAYLDQFYRPYMHYPGKIIAIPGNHDGESAVKIADFQKYFCAPTQKVPSIANSIFRQTMNQPGVYWCLDAPWVQIIGLYSNSAENPGFIAAPAIGNQQKDWLVTTLKALKAERTRNGRKALLFATHHPPYSSGGHSGSTGMLQDIDDACRQAGIVPDAFFSGHAHSIQRYTRSVQFGGRLVRIPYIVSGCGGHGDQKVATTTGVTTGESKYEFGYQGWGYTRVDVSTGTLTITSYGVDWNRTRQIDSVTVRIQ